VHGPPLWYGDFIRDDGRHVGSPSLTARILEVRPKLVACGHIHDGYGTYRMEHNVEGLETIVVNASQVDESYHPVNHPVVLELPLPGRVPDACGVGAWGGAGGGGGTSWYGPTQRVPQGNAERMCMSHKPLIRREDIPAECHWEADRWQCPPGLEEERKVELLGAAAHYDLVDRVRDFIAAKKYHDEAVDLLQAAEYRLRRAIGCGDYVELPSPLWRLGDYVVGVKEEVGGTPKYYSVTMIADLED
jgi:hypothetical protein